MTAVERKPRKLSTLNAWFIVSLLALGFAVGAWVYEKRDIDAVCAASLQERLSGKFPTDPNLKKLSSADVESFYRTVNAEVKADYMRYYLLDTPQVNIPILFSAFFLILGIIQLCRARAIRRNQGA